MNRSLLHKCVSDAKWLLLACGAAVFAYCWLRVWLVSRVDMSRFQVVLEQLWDTWGKFSPVPLDQVLTYPGRVAWTFTEPIVVFCISAFAIARGSDCISGELGRGSMEMLLAQPLSRKQVVLHQAFVTIAGVAVLCLLVWLGMFLGIQTNVVKEKPVATMTVPGTEIEVPNWLAPDAEPRVVPMSEKVDARVYFTATVNLFALGFFLAGMTTLFSSWDRYRWRTIGLAVGVYIVQSIMKIIAMAQSDFEWLSYGTFFTAYEPEILVSIAAHAPQYNWSLWLPADVAGGGWGPLGYQLILLLLGLFCYALAMVVFARRDLPAPI